MANEKMWRNNYTPMNGNVFELKLKVCIYIEFVDTTITVDEEIISVCKFTRWNQQLRKKQRQKRKYDVSGNGNVLQYIFDEKKVQEVFGVLTRCFEAVDNVENVLRLVNGEETKSDIRFLDNTFYKNYCYYLLKILIQIN